MTLRWIVEYFIFEEMMAFSEEEFNAIFSVRIHDIYFDILLIYENNFAKNCAHLDKPHDKEFIFDTWGDSNAGLEGSRFYNNLTGSVLVSHDISWEWTRYLGGKI